MSFTSPTGNTSQPPQNPPIIAQQQQQQSQSQTGPNSQLDAYFNDLDNNESEARSESRSQGDVQQSAIQINNIKAGEYGYGPGITRPTPFLSGTIFLNESDNGNGLTNYGGQISLVIPIGGRKSSRLSENLIAARTNDIRTNNAKNLLSICNSARAQGLELNYENIPSDSILHGCDGIFLNRKQVAKTEVPAANNALLLQMQKTIEELKRTNQSLQQQLNNLNSQNPYEKTGG